MSFRCEAEECARYAIEVLHVMLDSRLRGNDGEGGAKLPEQSRRWADLVETDRNEIA